MTQQLIDDAFEVAPDGEPARRQAHRLLGGPAAVEATLSVDGPRPPPWPPQPRRFRDIQLRNLLPHCHRESYIMSQHDWEACERDYRAGQLSVRHLATKHGIPESTIRSRAKAEGWQRDLIDEVRVVTRAKLSRTSRSEVAQGEDAQIIEQASNDATAIVTNHRQAIARWRGISNRLATALDNIEINEDNHDKVARSLNSGIDALGKTIRLERQAYGLDEEQQYKGKTLEELLDELAEAEREFDEPALS